MSCKDSVQTTAEPGSELNSDGSCLSDEPRGYPRASVLSGLEQWDPADGVKKLTPLQPSHKQRLLEQEQMKMEHQRAGEQDRPGDPNERDGDSSDDDDRSSNERLERRYRTRGRRGGRRRRKNRESEWPEAPMGSEGGPPPEALLFDGPDPSGPPWYPGVGSYFPPELEEIAKGMLQGAPPLPTYWNPRPMQPLLPPGPPAQQRPMPPPAPGRAPLVPQLPPKVAGYPPAYPQGQPAPAPVTPAARPTPETNRPEARALARPAGRAPKQQASTEQDTPLHTLLLQLLDSQITALLPEGAMEVDRGRLTRTLLSVYEQLQTLKGALGEKTTLTLLSLMMQQDHIIVPANDGADPAERRRAEDGPASPVAPSSGPAKQAASRPPAAPPRRQGVPELLQPTPTTARPPVFTQTYVPRQFPTAEDHPTDGFDRPPTESPGPLLPENLLDDMDDPGAEA